MIQYKIINIHKRGIHIIMEKNKKVNIINSEMKKCFQIQIINLKTINM